MTPIEQFVKINGINALGIRGWDWRAMLPTWAWHRSVLGRFFGWDMTGDAPPYVIVLHVAGTGVQSRDLAIAHDDVAQGLFYYRDWTDDGLPTCVPGDTYRSGFWFQRAADARAFVERVTAAGLAIIECLVWSLETNASR